MNITNVNIHNIFTDGKIKAVASIVIDKEPLIKSVHAFYERIISQ